MPRRRGVKELNDSFCCCRRGSKRDQPVHLASLSRRKRRYDDLVLTRATDTSADAAGVQAEAYRRMGPEGRLRVALEMSEEMARVLEDGVRARHPEYSEDDVRLAAIRFRLGDAIFRAVYPS
jgi:hypothetical protein